MAFISVNKSKLSIYSSIAKQMEYKLSNIKSDFESIGRNLDWDIKSASNITYSISQINDELDKHIKVLNAMADFLNTTYCEYKNLDTQALAQLSKILDMITVMAINGNILNNTSKGFSKNTDKNFIKYDGLNGMAKGELELKYGKYKDAKALHELEPGGVKFKDYVYDRKTGQASLPDFTTWAKKKGTLLEANCEAKSEASAIKMEMGIDGQYGNAQINSTVASAEAHASISTGLYVFDKDNNKLFAPGIDATVGASACLIAAGAAGRWGLGEDNNLLGVYGNAEASAGKVEAKAKITGTIFDEDGSVNIQAYGKASAEAIAAEAKGSAGVSVLGVDVGVAGSVSVGVGAHAEVGIVDGKLKVDVGAALGVGVSVGFEVDVGGSVNAVCGAAKSGWDNLFKT